MLNGYTITEDVAIGCLQHQYTAGARLVTFRCTRCKIMILMAAVTWLMSFSFCTLCGFGSYTVYRTVPREYFSWSAWKVRHTDQIHTRYRNWSTTAATQLQPSKSPCYIGYTSTWCQHDCSLTVQTLYTTCLLTPERISQRHVQNGRRATFSWPTVYL